MFSGAAALFLVGQAVEPDAFSSWQRGQAGKPDVQGLQPHPTITGNLLPRRIASFSSWRVWRTYRPILAKLVCRARCRSCLWLRFISLQCACFLCRLCRIVMASHPCCFTASRTVSMVADELLRVRAGKRKTLGLCSPIRICSQLPPFWPGRYSEREMFFSFGSAGGGHSGHEVKKF